MVCTLSCRPEGIFISYNNGENYRFITDHDFKRYDIHDSYLKPEYNGNRIPLHWMSNLQISPFNPDFAVFNTGTGIFSLDNLSKGIELPSLKRMSEVILEVLPDINFAVLSGPTLAREIIDGCPTLATIASADMEVAKKAQEL